MGGNDLIQLRDIYKQYNGGAIHTPVLQGIDLTIKHGEFIAIMGASGAGKSTLMNILSFLDRSTSGIYIFDGTETTHYDEDTLAEIRNKKIGFVFQMFHLLPNFSALENVKLPLLYAGITEEEQTQRAKKSLEQVGLGHRLDHTPNQLSGGEQQRVAIARALINEPKIIFADEPTGNLDSKASHEIMDIFGEVRKKENHTIIMVTHEPDIAAYAERVIVMKDGKIISDIQKTPSFPNS